MTQKEEIFNKINRLYEMASDEIALDIGSTLDSTITRIQTHIDQKIILVLIKDIPLYANRPNPKFTAIEFFEEHYRAAIKTGRFFADDLRHKDPQLYMTLKTYQSVRGLRMGDLLPLRPVAVRRPEPQKVQKFG